MMFKRATGDKPENIAKAISSAPTDEASYMIGAVVVVDGGQTID